MASPFAGAPTPVSLLEVSNFTKWLRRATVVIGHIHRRDDCRAGKLRFAWCLRDLADDGTEDRIAGREIDAFLDLNLKDGGLSLHVVRMNDDVIQRMPLGRSLEFNTINNRSRQSSRFCAHEEREQEGGADLAFKKAACWAGGCRACSLGDYLPNVIRLLGLSFDRICHFRSSFPGYDSGLRTLNQLQLIRTAISSLTETEALPAAAVQRNIHNPLNSLARFLVAGS